MFKIISLVIIVLFGNYFWHLLSYYTGLNIQITSFGLTVAIAIIGIILLIISFVKDESKSTSLYLIGIACAFFACYAKNVVYERFSNDCYQDGYLLFHEYEEDSWPNIHGLVDKYGKEFIKPRYDVILKVFDKKRKKDVFVGISVFYYKEAEADTIIQARGGDTENINGDDQICSFSVTTYSLEGERLDYSTITTMDCKDMEEYVFKHIGDILVDYCDRFHVYDEEAFFCIRKTSNSNNEENAEDETTEEIYSTEEPSQEENVEQNQHSNNVNQVRSASPEYETRDVWVDCMDCRGTGQCSTCHGNGWCVSTWSNGDYNETYKCIVCHGSGRCQMCYGNRGRYERQIFRVR